VLNAALREHRLADAPEIVTALPDVAGPELRPLLTTMTSVLLETLVERPEERVVLGGTANLTRSALDFPGTIRPVLEALEEQVVLLRLIGEVQSPSRVLVRIGEENPYEGLRSTSVVTVGYGPGDRALGGLGVLGPTRMDYVGTMSSVAAVARYIGQMLGSNG
jgi:heat-inducible transcriptional repressor